MRYKITADSTCDLGRDLIERYDIGILPLYVQLGDKTYRDGIDIQPDDIYAHVAAGGGLATTAAVNLADYVRAFTELSDRYDFVIHVNISSDFSCSHQNAKLAAADLPNVYVVDSRNLSTGMATSCSRPRAWPPKAWGRRRLCGQLEALTARVDASFILEQLEYMKKSGRCSAVALLGANLLKLRPCIEVKDGKMGVAKNVAARLPSVSRRTSPTGSPGGMTSNLAGSSSRTPACRMRSSRLRRAASPNTRPLTRSA